MKIFFGVLFFLGIAAAQNSMVQVPDSCVQKQITPCLIKAKTSVEFTWSEDVEIMLLPEALIEVQIHQQAVRFDVLSGQARFQAAAQKKTVTQEGGNYKIFGFDVKTAKAQFVSAGPPQIELFDTESLDLKTFVQEKNESKTVQKERSFVLQKSEFLNRSELVKYLSQFYSDAKAMKSVLANISVAYQNKLTSDSVKQAEFLKKKQDREIASIELEEKRRIAEQIQQEKDRKRSRELFFMRTFKQ